LKYESKFEQSLHNGPLKNFNLHPYTDDFYLPQKYTPDFALTVEGYEYIIESKGYLYTSHVCKMYTEYRKQLGKNRELIFLFQYPGKPINWKPIRKDGTKMTVSEWAEYNKFRWFTHDTVCVLLHEIRKRNNEKKT